MLPDLDAHPFDAATRIRSDESRWLGHTSPDYWAFVGPFGGITAATMLRGVLEHSDRDGDPLAMTVNYCAPVAEGEFELDIRRVRANRSSQHWAVEIIQNRETVALGSVVTALRRPSWSHQAVSAPQAPPFASVKALPRSAFAMAWTRQYDFRFIKGAPNLSGTPHQEPADARSTMWLGDIRPRIIDFPSLMSMSDAFFGRIFLARGEIVPFGTVSITTYFHVGADELAHEAATRVLASADGKVFHRSYGDQTGELWAESGKLLATTQQIAYFKA